MSKHICVQAGKKPTLMNNAWQNSSSSAGGDVSPISQRLLLSKAAGGGRLLSHVASSFRCRRRPRCSFGAKSGVGAVK